MNDTSLKEIKNKSRLKSILDPSILKKIAGKTVFVRTDFNVPLKKNSNKKNHISDISRIKAAIPTLTTLLKNNCKVVIASHLGRPYGKDKSLSMKQLLPVLKTELKTELESKGQSTFKTINQNALKIEYSSDCIGLERDALIANMNAGSVLLLENLRFHKEEQQNNSEFSRKLAHKIDVYVNEAFSVCHRKDASVVGITKHLPSFAGIALTKEVATWNAIMENPKKPFVMVIGGAKISDKVGAVQHLAEKADAILLGGGTANNFLKAEGLEIYQSYIEESSQKKKSANYVKIAEHLLETNRNDKIVVDGYIPLPKILMPMDAVAAPSFTSKKTEIIALTSSEVVSSRSDIQFLDIGPKTIQLFKEVIEEAGTIFWNGPMGVFEETQFQTGTREIAKAIANSKAYSVIGGGDSLAAAEKFGVSNDFNYISVAGGAALEFLSGKALPAISPLLQTAK